MSLEGCGCWNRRVNCPPSPLTLTLSFRMKGEVVPKIVLLVGEHDSDKNEAFFLNLFTTVLINYEV
jgi:hypothetical protein